MTNNRTTELLKDYAFALQRLEYDVDKPGSNMTLGEYEAEEKRVTDEYAKAIADELNAALGCRKLTADDYALENMLLKIDNDTRWYELFGTPERTARTLAKACGECSDKFPCWECPLSPIIGSNVYEPEILEWLRGEA